MTKRHRRKVYYSSQATKLKKIVIFFISKFLFKPLKKIIDIKLGFILSKPVIDLNFFFKIGLEA
jgi:hypothetical protein